MSRNKKDCPYFTWGCADDLTCRLKKTLYCSDDHDCYRSSSAALTDVVVTMFTEAAPCPRRKLKCQYASSIVRQLSLTPCALMLGILYSERLRQSKPTYGERVSSSDLYVISLLVASKFLHDEGEAEEIFNDEWAEAAGLSVKTVNRLEREFLDAMDWKVYATPVEFLEVCGRVETKIALKYGLRRGWFSYTDLTQFLLASNYPALLSGIAESVVKIIGGCVLVYGMSLSILASSVICLAKNNSINNSNNNNNNNQDNDNGTGISSSVSSTKLNCNGHSGTVLNTYNTDANCFITRRRRRILARNVTVGAPMDVSTDDDVLEDALEERLLDGRQSVLERKGSGRAENCACKRNSRVLCFEPSFRHLSHQTTNLRLPPNAGVPDNRFCGDTFFSDEACDCIRSSQGIDKVTTVGLWNKWNRGKHHLDMGTFRRFHARNLMPNPSFLGMVIM